LLDFTLECRMAPAEVDRVAAFSQFDIECCGGHGSLLLVRESSIDQLISLIPLGV